MINWACKMTKLLQGIDRSENLKIIKDKRCGHWLGTTQRFVSSIGNIEKAM